MRAREWGRNCGVGGEGKESGREIKKFRADGDGGDFISFVFQRRARSRTDCRELRSVM